MTIRYLLSFALPPLAALLLTPWAGRLAHRLGLLDRPAASGHKTHLEVTPYLGGLAVAGGW
jgi:UDP-N-acetylmuramyl pentapeptide phosphotransferase/UDP-N-acetylglucosamine-1-phosphate transferase